MAPHRVCNWADRKHHAVTSDNRVSQGAQNGEIPSAPQCSQGKITPEPMGREGCSRAVVSRGHTAVPPVGARLPSAILPTLVVLHSILIVGVLMEMLPNRELESGEETPGERI